MEATEGSTKPMLNITAHGHLGADPQFKTAPSGSDLAEFRLAARTGKDETTWLSCSVWGKRAKTAVDYLQKGSAITIVGRGKLVTYTKRNGEEASDLQVSVDDFTLPARKQERQEQGVPF